MTAKDFQFIADVLSAATVTANLTDTQVEDLAYEFAKKCATTNDRFKPAMFFRACAIEADNIPAMTSALAYGKPSLNGVLSNHRNDI